MTVGFDNPALALSPDGGYLSYISRSGQGTAVSLVELRTGQVRTLAGTEGATHSFFSPDSQQLGFLTGDRVKRVAVLGGATRTLCEAVRPTVFETDFVDTPGVSYDVSPDGQRLLIVKPAGRPVVNSQISLIVNWPAIVN